MFWSSVLVVNFMIILFCVIITDNVFTDYFRRLKLGSYGSELSVLLKQKTWRSPRVNILTNSRIFKKLRLTYSAYANFWSWFLIASDIFKNMHCLKIEIWTVPKKITNQWLSIEWSHFKDFNYYAGSQSVCTKRFLSEFPLQPLPPGDSFHPGGWSREWLV